MSSFVFAWFCRPSNDGIDKGRNLFRLVHLQLTSEDARTMMIRITAALLAAAAMPALAQETYALDPAHSRPTFEATHLGFSTQFGSFQTVTGKGMLDRAAKKGSVDVTIDANSVRLFDPRLEALVRGEKFFNVEKFPTITFKSNDVKFEGDNVVAVNGELTMVGVTKPLTLKVVDFRCGEQPFNKKPMCGGNFTATLKRSDWGITQGVSTMTPGDEVVLRIPFEAYKDTGA
jgi:polyisoprenoid-binding protein YceI